MKPENNQDDSSTIAPEADAKKTDGKKARPGLNLFKQGWAVIALFLVLAGGISYAIWWGYGRWQKEQEAQKPQQEPGLSSGHVIEKERLDDGLGLGSELLIDKRKGEPARIRFMLRDKDRKPVANASGQITFVQPANPANTITAPLKMDSPGVYRSDINLPEGGEWEARIAVRIGDNAFQTSKRVILP